MQKAARWPCGVCGRGVGSNSVQCTNCQKWVHKKCSGIKGSMYKVMKSFICRCCLNPVTSTGRAIVDIGASINLVLVDKFSYLGDILNVAGDADAAVEPRVWIGWNKFRQLVPLLTNRDYRWLGEGGCTAVVCKVVCYTEVRPACQERKRGGSSAGRDENGQMDVW